MNIIIRIKESDLLVYLDHFLNMESTLESLQILKEFMKGFKGSVLPESFNPNLKDLVKKSILSNYSHGVFIQPTIFWKVEGTISYRQTPKEGRGLKNYEKECLATWSGTNPDLLKELRVTPKKEIGVVLPKWIADSKHGAVLQNYLSQTTQKPLRKISGVVRSGVLKKIRSTSPVPHSLDKDFFDYLRDSISREAEGTTFFETVRDFYQEKKIVGAVEKTTEVAANTRMSIESTEGGRFKIPVREIYAPLHPLHQSSSPTAPPPARKPLGIQINLSSEDMEFFLQAL